MIAENPALADANILVYAADMASAEKQRRALDVQDYLIANGRGALSVQIVNEFFWNATRKLRPPLTQESATRLVEDYLDAWRVFDLTPAVILEALRGVLAHQFPFWDALIWATARLNGVRTVLSEDFNHGALIQGVRFLNPFDPGFNFAQI